MQNLVTNNRLEKKSNSMKILLIHQYAGNKGDRAVAFAMCNLIRSVESSIEITISTSSTKLWDNEPYYRENGIRFVTYSWDFSEATPRCYWRFLQNFQKYTFPVLRTLFLRFGKSCFSRFFINPEFGRAVNDSDIVISVGGHHFTTLLSRDLVSSINYDAMSVLLLAKPLVCFSQTFGKFTFYNLKNEQLTKKILSNCKLLLPREAKSADELRQMGIKKEQIMETYESVVTLNSLIKEYIMPTKRNKWVGIAIYATQHRETSVHENYVKTFVETCNYINLLGYEVRFFPMELKGTGPDDRILIRQIVDKVDNPSKCIIYDVDMPTAEHIQEVAKCQLFIGHKTHSTIFALATGTPLVGIAYHVKTREFMCQFNCEEYCIDDDKLTSESLINRVDEMMKNLDEMGTLLFNRAVEISNIVKQNVKTIIQ